MKVYVIAIQYQHEYSDGTEMEVHSNYENALDRFKEIISTEICNEDSWIFNAYDKNKKLKSNYTVDEHYGNSDGEFDCWYDIYDNFFTNRFYIHLNVIEVDKKNIEI